MIPKVTAFVWYVVKYTLFKKWERYILPYANVLFLS